MTQKIAVAFASKIYQSQRLEQTQLLVNPRFVRHISFFFALLKEYQV